MIEIILSWFALIYFAVNLASGVLTNARYSILLYPLFAFLAALGLREIAALIPSYAKRAACFIIPAAVVIMLAGDLWFIKPFYFNYVSPALPRAFAPHDGWGYGLYEAAQYLNALPQAPDTFIWSDRNGICQFLQSARCISGYKIDLAKTPPRYFVVSKRGVERGYVPRDQKSGGALIDHSNFQRDVLWRFDIGGRPDNFVLIIPGS